MKRKRAENKRTFWSWRIDDRESPIGAHQPTSEPNARRRKQMINIFKKDDEKENWNETNTRKEKTTFISNPTFVINYSKAISLQPWIRIISNCYFKIESTTVLSFRVHCFHFTFSLQFAINFAKRGPLEKAFSSSPFLLRGRVMGRERNGNRLCHAVIIIKNQRSIKRSDSIIYIMPAKPLILNHI